MFAVPVVPVVVAVSLFVVLVIIALLVYTIRRRYRYHDYTAVDKGPIKPEIINTATQDQALLSRKVSSKDSLAAISSDDAYFDALDNEDNRSISSRETSPVRIEPEEEEHFYPEGHIGRIWFSLSYDYNRESLTIVVYKIKNLPDRSATLKSCDPGVKISLLPSNQQLAQSRYKRKNKNPIFNEKFEVNLQSHELNRSTLCMSVVDGYRANQQTLIGHAQFPLKQLDTSKTNELQQDLTKPVEVSPPYKL